MMPYVVVIFGASGSGKTTLMRLLHASGGQYSIHFKTSDRPGRKYDDIELISDASFDPQKFDYVYQTYGHRYGIQRSQIEKAIYQNRHHFVICNDISTIQALKRDYGERVKAVFFHFDAPKEALLKIQRAREIDDDEIELRLAKTDALYRQFYDTHSLFDGVLVNYYLEEDSRLRDRMERLLSDFSIRDRDAISGLRTVAANLVKTIGPRYTGAINDYAFIIMPIREDDYGNIDVHQAIKRVCDTHGIRADRVDDIQYTGQITEKIQSSIELSRFIVADLTYERPNVYYEIGYADACSKPLILIARHGEKIHFDIAGIKVLFYKGIHDLELQLSAAVKSIMSL